MKAIEVLGTVDNQGNLSLDQPLAVHKHQRVRVIVLISEGSSDVGDEMPDDEILEPAIEVFRQGWRDVMTGNTTSIDQLWEGINAEPPAVQTIVAEFHRENSD